MSLACGASEGSTVAGSDPTDSGDALGGAVAKLQYTAVVVLTAPQGQTCRLRIKSVHKGDRSRRLITDRGGHGTGTERGICGKPGLAVWPRLFVVSSGHHACADRQRYSRALKEQQYMYLKYYLEVLLYYNYSY